MPRTQQKKMASVVDFSREALIRIKKRNVKENESYFHIVKQCKTKFFSDTSIWKWT